MTDPTEPAVDPVLVDLVKSLSRPCISLRRGDAAPETLDATDTFVSGHPYLPEGLDWPTGSNGIHSSFVGQFNFARLPAFRDFPREGLLQWFVDTDDVYGSYFDDEREGSLGFHVRFLTDLSLPSPPPTADYPGKVHGEHVFAGNPEPIPLVAAMGSGAPFSQDLPDDFDWSVVEPHALEAGQASPAIYWDFDLMWSAAGANSSRSHLGGFLDNCEIDPRGTATFFPADHPASQILVQVDGMGTEAWLGGSARLFGDPAALARGELSSIRYHWNE